MVNFPTTPPGSGRGFLRRARGSAATIITTHSPLRLRPGGRAGRDDRDDREWRDSPATVATALQPRRDGAAIAPRWDLGQLQARLSCVLLQFGVIASVGDSFPE